MTEENRENNKSLQYKIFCKLPKTQVNLKDIWADDIMNRQKLAATLYNFITRESNPLTIAIHGQWGAGKTFFLERWQEYLKSRGVTVVRLNAWEDDFLGDPMASLVGQGYAQIKKKSLKECWETLKEITPDTYRRLGMKALALVTCGVITEPMQALSIMEKAELDYSNLLQQKKAFQEKLTEFAQRNKQETNLPLVFVVDELDRCRPLYAIQFLERVKHFFEIPNIVFVLGVDLNNLKKSICTVYGDINADAYLRRFFDFEFLLESPSSRCYFETLAKRYNLEDLFVHDIPLSSLVGFKVAQYLFNSQRASLRQIEHFMRLIVFVFKSVERTNPETQGSYFCNILFILASYRVLEPEAYDELKNAFIDTYPIERLIKYIADNYKPADDCVFMLLYMLQYFSLEETSQETFLNNLNKYLPNPNGYPFPLSQIETNAFNPYDPLSRETKQEIALAFQANSLATSPSRFCIFKKLNFFCNLLDGVL